MNRIQFQPGLSMAEFIQRYERKTSPMIWYNSFRAFLEFRSHLNDSTDIDQILPSVTTYFRLAHPQPRQGQAGDESHPMEIVSIASQSIRKSPVSFVFIAPHEAEENIDLLNPVGDGKAKAPCSVPQFIDCALHLLIVAEVTVHITKLEQRLK